MYGKPLSQPIKRLAPVPEKPISANPRLNQRKGRTIIFMEGGGGEGDEKFSSANYSLSFLYTSLIFHFSTTTKVFQMSTNM